MFYNKAQMEKHTEETEKTKERVSLDGVTLQSATLEDIEKLLALEKSVEGNTTYSAMDEKELREEFETSSVFLVMHEGRAVGSVMYEIKNEDRAYISGIIIHPDFQGQGFAREALKQVLEKLREYKRIDLVTHPSNVAAKSLYESFGFVEESRKEDYYGDGEPRVVMVRG